MKIQTKNLRVLPRPTSRRSRRRWDASPEEIRQWQTIDNDCLVIKHISDKEIIANLSGASRDSQGIHTDEADDVVEPPPKVYAAIQGLDCALSWLETQDID